MTADVNYFVQAIVGVLVITDPVTRGFFFKTLTENQRVEFEVTQGAKGPQASNIRVLG